MNHPLHTISRSSLSPPVHTWLLSGEKDSSGPAIPTRPRMNVMGTQSAPPTYLPVHWKTGPDVPPEQGVLAGMTWAPCIVPLLSTSTQSLCLREFESHYLRTPARGPASLPLRHRGRVPGSFTTAALPAPVPPWSEVGRKAKQESGKGTERRDSVPTCGFDPNPTPQSGLGP